MSWSPERRATLVSALVVVGGLVSVRVGFAAFDQRQAVLALLAGWFVAGCGLVTWLRVPGSRTGILLVVAGAASFVGGVRWADPTMIAWLAALLAQQYTAVMCHSILTFPTGLAGGRRSVAAISTTYVAALVSPPLGPILVAAALLAGIGVTWLSAGIDARRQRRPAVLIGVLFAIGLVSAQAIPILIPAGARFDVRLVTQVAFMISATALSAVLLRESRRAARVTDIVVDLDAARGPLTLELARAIGDPTLDLGFWLPEQRRYVDLAGRPVDLPPDANRRTTIIERDGGPVAILVHDTTVTIDEPIRAATARAAELAAVNAGLQANVRAQASAVDASRRRILQASDIERRALQDRLHERVAPTLDDLEAAIAEATTRLGTADPDLDGAKEQLRQVRLDVASITDDLHPRVLDERGLRGAIAALAARSPIPVTLEWDVEDPRGSEIQAALYYVCSEALANVAKHADATQVVVRARGDARGLHLEIEDDGRGGAKFGVGTGLQGLQDRLATVDGELVLRSRRSGGTRLIATVPTEPRT